MSMVFGYSMTTSIGVAIGIVALAAAGDATQLSVRVTQASAQPLLFFISGSRVMTAAYLKHEILHTVLKWLCSTV